MPKKVVHTKIDGRDLKLSNLEKVLYPQDGIVKAQIIEYALNMSTRILQFAAHRPLTLIRYPDGVDGLSFYSKNSPDHTPDWIVKSTLPWDDENVYSILTSTPDVVYFANLAALELHITNARFPTIDFPDHFVIDIDPSEGIDFVTMVDIAEEIRSFLELRGFAAYVKTSGSKGIHILIPLVPDTISAEVMTHFRSLLRQFVKTHPVTTLELSKDKRKGKMFLDLLRNHQGNTTVAPWSLRAKQEASLSMPLPWSVLQEINHAKWFTISNYQEHKELFSCWDTFIDDSRSLIKSKPNRTGKYLPMLASAGKKIPDSEKYFFEVKWDGIRVLISKEGKKMTITSRSGRDITKQFPEITNPDLWRCNSCVIDGEIVVLDGEGRPQFSEVISRLHSKHTVKQNAVLYAFDCIEIDGVDITNQPIEKRREALQSLLQQTASLRYSDAFDEGTQLFEAIKQRQMEGIMAKKRGSKYHIGNRTNDWLKLKVRQDAVCSILGYTEGSGDRSPYFGSLVLGKEKDGEWIYMGRVGTGFDMKKLEYITTHLKEVEKTKKTISEKIDEEHKTTWIEPRLQCEISYASMSSNDTYREPVFKRLLLKE